MPPKQALVYDIFCIRLYIEDFIMIFTSFRPFITFFGIFRQCAHARGLSQTRILGLHNA